MCDALLLLLLFLLVSEKKHVKQYSPVLLNIYILILSFK